MIETRLVLLRKIVRKSKKSVVDQFIKDHDIDICIICGNSEDLTKEHVMPKWAFGNDQNKSFETTINGISQSYSKTTLPACSYCNSYILGAFERYIETLFSKTDLLENTFSNYEKEKIILWLEFIDYKFQILNLRRKLIKPKNGSYGSHLVKFPVGIMQKMDISPSKVFSNYRQAFKKLSVKSKKNKVNSLVVYSTSNEGFHFFHKVNEMIFLEFPKQKVALFYFINEEFVDEGVASEFALEVIKSEY